VRTHTSATLDKAISEWTEVLGAEFVITDSVALRTSETATFETTQQIPAILRPQSREEVQECVRIANRNTVPVYVVSTGFNWGYGSRVPVTDQCVVMELRRMNRILDYSEDLAYITVEPGVTQRQVIDFLEQNRSGLWIDATGSTPDCSLIGNTMERGFGHTPYGDHFANSCGLEVVLPNGELVETGFSRFPNAQAGSVYRWGVGPTIDGLFSQSNLGIVTRMTIWLMPAPEYFQAYFFRCDLDSGLEQLIDALRPLRLNNTIRSASHIVNDYKVISSLQPYPWEVTRGQTPLTPELLRGMYKRHNFGAWNGSGGLYGTKGQVAEARRLIKSALAPRVNKLQFVDDRLLSFAGRFATPYKMVTNWDLSRALELVKPVYGLMRGIPTDKPLRSTYWRKRTPVPESMDPDRDGCGLLWCAPVAPMTGDHVRGITRIAYEVLLGHGFEPMISITLITERAVACVITIAYDRAVAGEDQKAMRCYQELLGRLWSAGYYSYRLGIQSMQEMSGDNGFNHVLRTFKGALDPKGVLSPGRYQPRSQAE
jgi:4-cresol dehydrogenase (hydroxylating)